MLIQGFLQVSTATFAIFYHHALAKTSDQKADDRSLSFVLGVEIAIAIFFLATYFIITFFMPEKYFENPVFLWIMSGIFLAIGIFMFFFYFRPGKKLRKTTELYIPRRLAKFLLVRAEHSKSRFSTILLGFITTIIELPFILPLLIVSSVGILSLSPRFGFVFIIAYIIIATLPLFTIRTFYCTGHNLAEIQRARVKQKLFFRFVLTLSYLLLAIITFIPGVTKW